MSDYVPDADDLPDFYDEPTQDRPIVGLIAAIAAIILLALILAVWLT